MSQPRISNEQNPSRRSDFKGLMENLEENYNKLNLENQKLNKKISSLDKEIVQYKEKIGTLETENFTYKNELIRYQHEIEPKYNEKIKNMEIQYNNNMAKYKQEVEAFYNNIIAGLKAEADNSNRVLIEAIERLNRRLENPNLFNQPILGDDEVYVQPNSYPPPLPPKPLIGNSPRNSIEKPSPVPQIPSSDDKKIVDFTRGARPWCCKYHMTHSEVIVSNEFGIAHIEDDNGYTEFGSSHFLENSNNNNEFNFDNWSNINVKYYDDKGMDGVQHETLND
ncbi:21491_t:CDS:2 [Entrophospora sp. SA101]|nr:21491_t:CDS:2 [Entrophospora sp. SA101]